MGSGNSCRYETRLGVALGFVAWPEHDDVIPDTAVYSGRVADVGSLCASLPAFGLARPALDLLHAAQQADATTG